MVKAREQHHRAAQIPVLKRDPKSRCGVCLGESLDNANRPPVIAMAAPHAHRGVSNATGIPVNTRRVVGVQPPYETVVGSQTKVKASVAATCAYSLELTDGF